MLSWPLKFTDLSHFGPYTQDKIQQTTHYSRGPNHEKSDSGSTYAFEHPQSDGNQVQTSFTHAGPYHHPSSVSQPYQHNQFTPNYPNSPTPTPTYLNSQSSNIQGNFDRFSTTSSSSSSQLQASRNHSYKNFTGYSRFAYIPFPQVLDSMAKSRGALAAMSATFLFLTDASPSKADLHIKALTCRGVRRALRSGKDTFELYLSS
jgi:hypothetical protein